MPRYRWSAASIRHQRWGELQSNGPTRSRAESARVNCALEEADESAFWLEVIIEGRLSSGRELRTLLEEANQLCAIFAASSITATEAERRGDRDPHNRRRR